MAKEYMHQLLEKDAVCYDLPSEEIIQQLAEDNERLTAENETFREEDGWKDIVHNQTNKIIKLEAELKAKDEALRSTQQMIEWAEKQIHLNCSGGYVPMMPHGDPEPCEWCRIKREIKQALTGETDGT